MKRLLLSFFFLVMFSSLSAQNFDDYFTPKTLRFDYIHSGTSTTQAYHFERLKEEPFWAGSRTNLIDDIGFGNQIVKLFDSTTGNLIYSKGLNTLFDEWQYIDEAKKINRSYRESIIVPMPKAPVKLQIQARDTRGNFSVMYEQDINPNDYNIEKYTPKYQTFDVHYQGSPDKKVDIVLLSEGYSAGEYDLFKKDCEYFKEQLLLFSPFKENSQNINIRGVWSPSKDSGVTLPGEHVWRETVLSSNFYTFDSERYLTISDMQRIRDVAAAAPYDVIYVLANTQKYGGGGIYNFYGISAAHHPSSTGTVYVHEFGHLFAGLADEYVGGITGASIYSLDIEPWEANITTLTNFKSKEWSKMLPTGTEVPTKASKENPNKLGVFEGAGYEPKGIYRPRYNCLMNSLNSPDFCPVCQKTLQKVIDSYTK